MIVKFDDFIFENVDIEMFPKEVDEQTFEKYFLEKEKSPFSDIEDDIIESKFKGGYGGNFITISKDSQQYNIEVRKKRKYPVKKLGYGPPTRQFSTHFRYYKFKINKFSDEYYSIHMVNDIIVRSETRGSSRDTIEKYWIVDQVDELSSFISHIEKFSKTNKIEFI